jgi:plastocyanin
MIRRLETLPVAAVAAVAAVALFSVTGSALQRDKKAVTHAVAIDASRFAPSRLTIDRGDTVVWTNQDVVPHTATSEASNGLDTKSIAPGGESRHTFTARGDVPYICSFHPGMKGQIRVR